MAAQVSGGRKSTSENNTTHSKYKEPDYIFTHRKEQRTQFQNGNLVKRWKEIYPELFVEVDVRFARNQPDNHPGG